MDIQKNNTKDILYDAIRNGHEYFIKYPDLRFAVYEQDYPEPQYVNYEGVEEKSRIIDFHLKNWPKGSPEYRGIFKVRKIQEDSNRYSARSIQGKTPFIDPIEESEQRQQEWNKFIHYILSRCEEIQSNLSREIESWDERNLGTNAILLKMPRILELMREFQESL